MSTLADMQESELGIAAAVHLLLAGPSKTGKTRYIVEWIKDGGTCIYFDNDNGLNTLYNALKSDPAALARVIYVPTKNLFTFMQYFFAGRKVLQWNKTRDDIFQASKAGPDDDILEIQIDKIPFGVLHAFDSWSSASITLLQDAASKNNVSMETFNEGGEAVYGDAFRRANVLCSLIQAYKGHVIVQAHVDYFERWEKPKGSSGNVKRKDMIIKENVQIPQSVSRPHGFQMAKYFNEFGWMVVGPTGAFKLDFRQQHDRVGGGTLMNIGDPMAEFRLSKTLIKPREVSMDWFRSFKASEILPSPKPVAAPAAANTTTAPALTPVAPTSSIGLSTGVKSGGLLKK